jgi:hypothetical protein
MTTNDNQSIEDLRVSGGIDPRIPNLGTRCRWVASFMLRAALPRRKSLQYPPNKMDRPQSQSGRGGEECPNKCGVSSQAAINLYKGTWFVVWIHKHETDDKPLEQWARTRAGVT